MLAKHLKKIEAKEEFAKKIGCHVMSINRWLRGDCLPNLQEAIAIKTVTGASLDYIAEFLMLASCENEEKIAESNLTKNDKELLKALLYRSFWRKAFKQ